MLEALLLQASVILEQDNSQLVAALGKARDAVLSHVFKRGPNPNTEFPRWLHVVRYEVRRQRVAEAVVDEEGGDHERLAGISRRVDDLARSVERLASDATDAPGGKKDASDGKEDASNDKEDASDGRPLHTLLTKENMQGRSFVSHHCLMADIGTGELKLYLLSCKSALLPIELCSALLSYAPTPML